MKTGYLRQIFVCLTGNMGKLRPIRFYMTRCTSPRDFSSSDIGLLYEISQHAVQTLGYERLLPSNLIKQSNVLGELVVMVREPLIEVSSYMLATQKSFPALRLVLWGPFGTGKSVTLCQAVHMAYAENMVIVHLRTAMDLTRRVREVQTSTFKQGRINDPLNAIAILQCFKEQNQHVWQNLNKLQTDRDFEWPNNERLSSGRPITDLVEIGISTPLLASDCVGGLFRELKRLSSAGAFKLFVAIDDANSLWGKTLVKKADRTYASPSELTLVVHFRSLISSDWNNGCILLVADKKEHSNARDHITVPRITPLELFGEEGFQCIEPFLPIETKQYTKKEVSNMYQYYYDRNWLASEKGNILGLL
ncbi:hypothetical protein DICVIV_03449 [Dictyocaulus viviparus]|uniref:Small ribosomal subunit protein mS29 n=1 Tax=Dictyocaulus viviparus TaxID=29172 RepID=A0A0D8Y0N9_DICVI|nr:hypothetical protein DICVIV_03449 [Dictyocaulus viviparus]